MWAQVNKIFGGFKLFPTNVKRWGIRWCCTKDLFLSCIHYMASTEVYLRHEIKTTLKSVSSEARKGCFINVLYGNFRCWRSHSFGLETSQVEETNIMTILNSNAMRWLEVTVRYKSYGDYNRLRMIGVGTQPYFTPTSTEKLEDREPTMSSWAQILVWNRCCMTIKVGGQPNLRRMFQRMSLLTVSIVFVRSTKAIYKTWCWSRHISCSWRTTNIMSIVLRPRLQPNWDSGKTRSTMCSRRRVSIILASTFSATEIREMRRLLPQSALTPFCLYTRIMLAFLQCCWKHIADQHSGI